MLFGTLVAGPARALAVSQPAVAGPVDVIEVKGRIDRIEADFIGQAIASAAREHSQLLIVQLDSPGATLSEGRLTALATRIQRSAVPVAVWVGPSGAGASHEAVRLLRAAAIAGMANGAHIGPLRGPCPECRPDDPLAGGKKLGAGEATRLKAVDYVTPTLGDFIVGLDGVSAAGRQFRTAEVVERNGQRRREPIAQVRFAKLDLVGRLLHATTNPWLAYTLLVLGLLLIVFEFFSVGVGLAGLTGAIAVALSAYGLAALGATPLGLALTGVAVFGYAVDVQAGAPRAWTVIGSVALLVGSWTLYPADRRVAWWTILVVFALALLFAVRGMTTMVRARFSTPTIGRESMIGEAAEATTAIDPEGTVRVRGALWRARAKQVAPIEAGAGVRVVAIDGLVLEVAPDEPASGPETSSGG